MSDAEFASCLRLLETRFSDPDWIEDPDCITALLYCCTAKMWKVCCQWQLTWQCD
ncbi:hypothetical protein [Synechococcus sp. PCC 7336]|uniref:hypothetical protein n=1 Tax=Synechococcus sp. PCC 7336 TaxID=195250 RepID=UPI00034B2591|nr:hypothetical protein [Synechococcus sp. PCC 7336]